MEKHVVGKGQATFGEFTQDFCLSAKRATLAALQELQRMLNEAPELRATVAVPKL